MVVAGGRRQVQDAHILHVGAFAAPPFEGVVGQPEVPGGKQLLSEAVAGKGPGFAHQGPDDVAVIDVGFPLTVHPLQAFHQATLVVHFHPVGVQPDPHLLTNEPGGNGVGPAGYLARLYA